MQKSKEEIITDIKNHIKKEGSGYKNWYVGISQDARKRLFTDHGVKRENSWWILRIASSSKIAREIEDHFVNNLGTDGGPGGGDKDADMIYAYKKTSNTNP